MGVAPNISPEDTVMGVAPSLVSFVRVAIEGSASAMVKRMITEEMGSYIWQVMRKKVDGIICTANIPLLVLMLLSS